MPSSSFFFKERRRKSTHATMTRPLLLFVSAALVQVVVVHGVHIGDYSAPGGPVTRSQVAQKENYWCQSRSTTLQCDRGSIASIVSAAVQCCGTVCPSGDAKTCSGVAGGT